MYIVGNAVVSVDHRVRDNFVKGFVWILDVFEFYLAYLRNALDDRFTVAPRAGGLDRTLVDVGTEDLYFALQAFRRERLLEENRNRVDLFTR